MSTYYIFDKINIPPVVCVQDWFTEKCSYCSNWMNANSISQCNNSSNEFPMTNYDNINKVSEYLRKLDWVDSTNQYSQTCTPSSSGASPASCTTNSSANDKNVVKNDYKNPYASNWTANNVYVESRYNYNNLLNNSNDHISLYPNNNNLQQSVNVPLNLFNETCDYNTAIDNIQTSINLKRDINYHTDYNSNQYKNIDIPVPTTITYQTNKNCKTLNLNNPQLKTTTVQNVNNLQNDINIYTGGAIQSIRKDNNNKIINYYIDPNYNVTSTTGTVINLKNNDVNLYLQDSGKIYMYGNSPFKDLVNNNTTFNYNDLMKFTNTNNIKLTCPNNYYLSGYNYSPSKNTITPYCIKFERQVTSEPQKCLADGVWPESTVSSEPVSIPCPRGYTGTMTRGCGASGWQAVHSTTCQLSTGNSYICPADSGFRQTHYSNIPASAP